MKVTQDVISLIGSTLGATKRESGGIIGSRGGVVCAFEQDRECENDEYIPDIELLNKVIRSWHDDGIEFEGIIHSHMSNNKLSFADIAYARRIICHNESDQIFMLLYVQSEERVYAFGVNERDVFQERVDVILE